MSRTIKVTWAPGAIEDALERAQRNTQTADPDEACRVPWMDLAALVDLGRHAFREAGGPDWRRIAVQLHRFKGAFHGLTTPERDALEAEIRERDEADRDVVADRTTDAASFHEESHDG